MLFFLVLIVAFVCNYILPWWSIAIVSGIATFFMGKSLLSCFGNCFFAVSASWTILALFKSVPNDHLLAKRISTLLFLPSWWLVLVVTAVLGGLTAGLGAISGYFIRKAFR